MTTQFDPAKLDFEQIKTSLKRHFEDSGEFNDYDFEGSALSSLLDVLAWNTHFNALTANLSLNESFIDTAQMRSSVISHAKALNYLPRTMRSASSVVTCTLLNVSENQSEILIPKYTKFTTNIDGKVKTFYTLDEYRVNSQNSWTFEGKIYEGKLITKRFVVDSYENNNYPIYVIPDANLDSSTLTVLVKDGLNSNLSDTYTPPKNVSELTPDFNNYFIYESPNGYYEIILGDGIVGKKPPSGSIIDATYLKSSGEQGNGAKTFTVTETFEGYSLGVTASSRSSGGSERESISSIKFNAPKSFEAQNRAVTKNDYLVFLQQEVSNIEAVNVWGGEENDPPQFGVVYICIKPVGAEKLSDSEKTQIKENVLENKNIISITPLFVDPDFQFLEIKMNVRYDSKLTALTKSQLETRVKEEILNYSNTELSTFNSTFRKSRLMSFIDDAFDEVVSVDSEVLMQRKFKPELGVKARYDLSFTLPFANVNSEDTIVSSDSFTYNSNGTTYTCTLRNKKNSNTLEIVRPGDSGEIVVQDNAGFIDTVNNKLVISPFTPISFPNTADGIRISVKPSDENTIKPKRNLLIKFDELNTAVSAIRDDE